MKIQDSDLGPFLKTIWAELGDFTRSRDGQPGLATLATIGTNGPELRHVVLRKADRANSQLVLHSDVESTKIKEIERSNAVSLLVWNSAAQLQLRIKGRAEVLGAYAAEQVWSDLPFASRGNYGVNPTPGTPISARDAYERVPDKSRLAVISVQVRDIDALRLDEPRHMRAHFTQSDNWRGSWLAP